MHITKVYTQFFAGPKHRNDAVPRMAFQPVEQLGICICFLFPRGQSSR
jgi:hypothetical protein